MDYGKYGKRICDRGGDLVPARPLHRKEMAFKAFANVKSDNELLAFVKIYGLLDKAAYDRKVPGRGTALSSTVVKLTDGELVFPNPDDEIILRGEDVEDHLKTARLFRDLLSQSHKGWRNIPTFLEGALAEALDEEGLGAVGLVWERRVGLRMIWSASTLMNGLWLQLATHLGQGARYQVCELPSCGSLFEVGVRAGRRADARFCCSRHQVEFNSRRRSRR